LLIALTGYGQREDVMRAKDAGFDHHFVKPADPEHLARCIAEAHEASAKASTSEPPKSAAPRLRAV
jgi:CheY-like chemotaxis protein